MFGSMDAGNSGSGRGIKGCCVKIFFRDGLSKMGRVGDKSGFSGVFGLVFVTWDGISIFLNSGFDSFIWGIASFPTSGVVIFLSLGRF